MTTWNFDEDLGGTFALDKIAAGHDAEQPIDEIEPELDAALMEEADTDDVDGQ